MDHQLPLAQQLFLEGTGTTGPVLNNGTISPGTSIGTLTVVGTYTQGPGGTFFVEIDDSGNSDLLIVTGVPGVANLDGAVDLDPIPGIYTKGTVYTILQANTINGQFSPALLPILDPLLRLSQEEFAQALLQFGPQNFGALGLTRMQTNTSIGHSMNQISGEFQKLLNGDRACNDSSSLWIEQIGYYYKQNELEEQTPFNDRTYGFTLGYKKTLFNHLLVSIGGGYSHSNLNWYRNRGDASTQSVYIAPGVGYVGEWGYGGLLVQGSRTFL